MNISQIKNAIDGLSQEQLLDLNRYIVNKSKQNASLAVYNFKAGDKVTFTARGTVYTGVVVKSLQKNVQVDVKGMGLARVTATMLKKI